MASHAVVSGEPDVMITAATIRVEQLERVASIRRRLDHATRDAVRACPAASIDRSLCLRIDEIARCAWELDHNLLTTGQQLSTADRRRSLTTTTNELLPILTPQARADVRSGRYQLLRFDPSGDGRSVMVFGDLADAQHVAVIVPGMSNQLDNVESLAHKCESLRAQMIAAARPGEPVAVIGWLGYNPPDGDLRGLADASQDGAARRASEDIVADVARLRQLARPGVHMTVVAHSYGSRAVGDAMRLPIVGLDVDDVVAVGSPGMGTDSRAALGHPRTRVWAMALRTDLVRFAPAHGEDPTDNGYGARRLPSTGAKGHGGYFEPGTGSLAAIADVAVAARPVFIAGSEPRRQKRNS
jgi:hypothetical protein